MGQCLVWWTCEKRKSKLSFPLLLPARFHDAAVPMPSYDSFKLRALKLRLYLVGEIPLFLCSSARICFRVSLRDRRKKIRHSVCRNDSCCEEAHRSGPG